MLINYSNTNIRLYGYSFLKDVIYIKRNKTLVNIKQVKETDIKVVRVCWNLEAFVNKTKLNKLLNK